LLVYKKKSDEAKWKDYDVVELTEFEPQPWGLAVKLEDKDGAWGKFMSDTVKDWLSSGELLKMEKKWLGQNTKWLEDASAKAKK
jgi:polar amino acid transport system substrate-binding protein